MHRDCTQLGGTQSLHDCRYRSGHCAQPALRHLPGEDAGRPDRVAKIPLAFLSLTSGHLPLPGTFFGQQAGGQQWPIARVTGHGDKYKRANGVARPFCDLFIHTVHLVPHQIRSLFQKLFSSLRE